MTKIKEFLSKIPEIVWAILLVGAGALMMFGFIWVRDYYTSSLLKAQNAGGQAAVQEMLKWAGENYQKGQCLKFQFNDKALEFCPKVE